MLEKQPTQSSQPVGEKPLYECVSADDGSWENRYRNARVTPPVPDNTQSSPSRIRLYLARIRAYGRAEWEKFSKNIDVDLMRNRPSC